MCYYWYLIVSTSNRHFIVCKNFTRIKLQTFDSCNEKMNGYFLDHYNYERCAAVHLFDLMSDAQQYIYFIWWSMGNSTSIWFDERWATVHLFDLMSDAQQYIYLIWWHLFDLMTLYSTCPDVYGQFLKRNFSFQKSNRRFSKIALDQVNELRNDKIRGVSGATHLLNRVGTRWGWNDGRRVRQKLRELLNH